MQNTQQGLDLCSPRVLHDLMDEFGLSFTKSLGQNFLIDRGTLGRIIAAAGITKEDNVIEIGPGAGVLTVELARAARKVVAVEIDEHLRPLLELVLTGYDNAEVVFGDVLKQDFDELVKHFDTPGYKVVANLPYYITTPIIMELLERGVRPASMTFLIQKEVGERLCAEPGSKTYGSLTVAAGYYAMPQSCGIVPPTVFMPHPAVDSVIVNLIPYREPLYKASDEKLFFRVVREAFGKRRKTLLNALAMGMGMDKDTLLSAFIAADIEPDRRAETLDVGEFVRLAAEIGKLQ